MAKVLVTGGAGFIGSHLVDALVARGDEVRVLDDFSSGKRENLNQVADAIELIEGDIRDGETMRAALQSVENVFHQAAMVSVPESIKDPMACYAANVDAVIDLMQQAHEQGVRSMVLASSTAVYGASEQHPLREEQAAETLSPYAASKLFNENLARIYAENYDLHAVALRFFNVYGPRQRPNSDYAAVIPRFVRSLRAGEAPSVYGDGEQTRDFIYVADVVEACLAAETNQSASGQFFNVCSGQETSINDLLVTLEALFPKAPAADYSEPRLGDVPRSVGDPKLAREVLGFEARVDLAAGLAKTSEAWQ